MPEDRWRVRLILVVRIVISGAALLTALYVIISNKYPDAHVKWAFGIVGLVIGYWLR
ncbi:MAG TPA: hypothetical protein VK881_07840 [bacterium]|nr:hypothetical protein [bacterium]